VKDPTRICYICGFDFDSEAVIEKLNWPFIFCPCCCFEYGIDDLDLNCFMTARTKWLNEGLKFGFEKNPSNYSWTLKDAFKQLRNLHLVDLANYPDGIKMNPDYTNYVDLTIVHRLWDEARNKPWFKFKLLP